MSKPEWGKRYICYKCGKSYYDLNKPEPRCPACGANPAKAPARGSGSKSKLQNLIPKEVDTDIPIGDEEEDMSEPMEDLEMEMELPEEDEEE